MQVSLSFCGAFVYNVLNISKEENKMKTSTKTMTKKILGAAKVVTEKELVRSANTASCILMHQPKAPKALSKMRKF